MKIRRLLILTSGLVSVLAIAFAAKEDNLKASTANLNSTDFVKGVTNEFFPLHPGTTFFYTGNKDGVPAENITSVTHQTKRILGVNCTAVNDRAFENGKLVEETFDWFA